MADPVLDNPLSFTPFVQRRGKVMYLPVWQDRNNDSIVNSAYQLPIKPLYEPFAVQLIVATFAKRRSETDAYCAQFKNKVNSDSWRAWGERRAWVMDISTDPSELNGEEVDEIQVTVACLDRKWDTYVPEVGYNYKDGADLVTFKASDGGRYIGKLTLSGAAAAVDADLLITQWETKQPVSFAALGF